MSKSQTGQPWDRDAMLGQLLHDYQRSFEKGRPLDRDKLLAKYPDLAEDLRSFFASFDATSAATPSGVNAVSHLQRGRILRGRGALVIGLCAAVLFVIVLGIGASLFVDARQRALAVEEARRANQQAMIAMQQSQTVQSRTMTGPLSQEMPQMTSFAPSAGMPGAPGSVRRSLWPVVEQGNVQAHLWGTAFSPDGKKYLAYGDSGPRGAIRLWDVATGQQPQEFRTGKDVWFSNARFLSDGEHIVTAYSNNSNVYLWDVATGKLVHEFPGHTAAGVVVFVSHDGRHVVSSGKDNTLRLWDMALAQAVWSQDVSGEQITGVSFSPDDNLILTTGDSATLRIRELKTGQIVGRLEGHAAACAGEFLPDGKQAISWAQDGQIRLWDVGTLQTLHQFDGRAKVGRQAWVLDEGRQVLSWGQDHVFRVWDAASGEKLREIAVAEMRPPGWTEAAVSPDGQRLLVANSDGDDVRLLDLVSGRELYRSSRGQLPMARGFSFSPDGKHLAAGSFRTGVFLVSLPASTAEAAAEDDRTPVEN